MMELECSAVQVLPTGIPEVRLIIPPRYYDDRGFVSETYSQQAFSAAGILTAFVQDNHSYSCRAGTLRGLHFQAPPHSQAKIVQVPHGAVLDVAVDLRHGSPTFGRHVIVELSASNRRQLFIPRGFAHGFITLAPNTDVIYKVDAYYASEHDRGVRWDDPDLAIPWPPPPSGRLLLSAKDRQQPLFKELPSYFVYDFALE